MLQPRDVKQMLVEDTCANSGLENRGYLGMSGIWRCPVVLYDAFLKGRSDYGWDASRNCYEGYMHERDIIARLSRIGLYCPGREIIAPFDGRLRGHNEGELVDPQDGTRMLFEFKSLNQFRFDELREQQRLFKEHFYQVQAYMLYGLWQSCIVIYKNRNDGELWTFMVRANRSVQFDLDRKARAVLAAIDAGRPPACDCGKHNSDHPSIGVANTWANSPS